MNRLPVMVGFGGINPAGRLSFHHGYRRMVVESLPEAAQARTFRSLASLMRLDGDPADAAVRQHILDHTLIRRIELWDPEQVTWQSNAKLDGADGAALTFTISKRQLPETVPSHWQVTDIDERTVRVTCAESMGVLLPEQRVSKVSSAGQVPTGFEPGALYASRNHPGPVLLFALAGS